MNIFQLFLNEVEKVIDLFFLEVEKQELVEVVVLFEFVRVIQKTSTTSLLVNACESLGGKSACR